LAEIQFLNDPSRPLAALSDVDRDRTISSVAARVAELAEAVRQQKAKQRRTRERALQPEPESTAPPGLSRPVFFISHSREDGDFAELLKLKLEQAGYTAWIDSDRLGPGVDWRQEIDQAIKKAGALIAVMSVDARGSEYVTYEWAFAWGAGVKVIPIMLRETPLHPRLATLQYLDFSNRIARPWDRLFSALAEIGRAQAHVSAPPK
jgi:hypothetical protein